MHDYFINSLLSVTYLSAAAASIRASDVSCS